MMLRHYLSQGMTKTAIAARLEVTERTIRRWVAAGELDRDVDEPVTYRKRPPATSKFDPFKPFIDERLKVYPKLSSVRLLEEIRPAGYAGSYELLHKYVRNVRPQPAVLPVVRFETPAGHQTHSAMFHRRTLPSSSSHGGSATR